MKTKLLLVLSVILCGTCLASQELKQSTQIVVAIGPFVDKTDGLTPEVDIDFTAADECHIMKANGAAAVSIKAATWADYPDVNGFYKLTLTTSHTDTLGPLTIAVHDDSVCLPVMARFSVIDPNVWDQKYSTGELKGVDLDNMKGGTILDVTDAAYASAFETILNDYGLTATRIGYLDTIPSLPLIGDIETAADDVWGVIMTGTTTYGTAFEAQYNKILGMRGR